jgi:hypothetical protein
LLRRELTWEETQQSSRKNGTSTAQSADQSGLLEGFAPMTSADLLEDAGNESAIWTPEIVALRFRYFDGHSWRQQWDSREQKALPVAVEIAYRLEPIEATRRAGAISDRLNQSLTAPLLNNEAGKAPAGSAQTPDAKDESLASVDFDDVKKDTGGSDEGHLPVFRQIISLAAALKGARSNQLQGDDAFTPVAPARAETSLQQEGPQP